MRTPFLAVVLLALVGCSRFTPSLDDQSLTTVRLDIDGGTCSGTIIAPSVILTAEHCLREKAKKDDDDSEEQGPPAPPKKPDPKKPEPKKADPKKVVPPSPFNDPFGPGSPFPFGPPGPGPKKGAPPFPFFLIKPPSDPTSMEINGMKTKINSIVSDGNDHVLVGVDHKFDYTAHLGARPEAGAHIHYWGNPAGEVMLYREGYVTSYHHGMMMMDAHGFFGDSGAGIFDENGNVVDVMNIINVHEHMGLDYTLMGAAELEFTKQQLHMMGVD